MKWRLIAVAATACSLSGGLVRAQFILNNNNGNNGNGGYNDSDQRELAQRAAVKAAQGELDRSTELLQASIKRVRTTWKADGDYSAAEKDLAAKRANFDKVEREARQNLAATNPDYMAARKAAGEMDQKVEDATVANDDATTQPASSKERIYVGPVTPSAADGSPTTKPAGATVPPPPTADQVAAAEKKLRDKTKMHDIEEKAFDADPKVMQAKADLATASARMDGFKKQLDAALQNDSGYQAALQQVASAKSHLSAASAQY